MTKLNVLVLYDATPHVLSINAIRQHLESFRNHSAHNIFYTDGANRSSFRADLNCFDVLVHHYSLRLRSWHISPTLEDAYRRFSGLKVLFIQDEYEATHTSWHWMTTLGFHLVFTCVPPQYIEYVYPCKRFPDVTFIPTLTGYVPAEVGRSGNVIPHALRRIHFGYRGRRLPYWYGTLGREKEQIGERMRGICAARGIPFDIETEYDKRLLGDDWRQFLSKCRAMLGTESGSNVFDFDGSVERSIREATCANPDLSFEEIYSRYLGEHERNIQMNQVSPKIFESIASRTALVLFDGSYSGVVIPDRHFIPLKKDFSNVETVINKVADAAYVTELTERAFNDIIASGKYSYESFVHDFDKVIAQRATSRQGRLVSLAVMLHPTAGEPQPAADSYWFSSPVDCTAVCGSPRIQPVSIEVRRLWSQACAVFAQSATLGLRIFTAVLRRLRRIVQGDVGVLRWLRRAKLGTPSRDARVLTQEESDEKHFSIVQRSISFHPHRSRIP